MKTYTFKSGAVLTEQEVISRYYGKYWKISYLYSRFIASSVSQITDREDLFLLFSAFDKYKDLTNEN